DHEPARRHLGGHHRDGAPPPAAPPSAGRLSPPPSRRRISSDFASYAWRPEVLEGRSSIGLGGAALPPDELGLRCAPLPATAAQQAVGALRPTGGPHGGLPPLACQVWSGRSSAATAPSSSDHDRGSPAGTG